MSVDDRRTAPPDAHARRLRRPARTYLVIALLIAVIAAGVGYTVLVGIVGYCSEDLLQLEADVTSRPYVQNVSATAATVMWRTANEVDGIVRYGTGGSLDHTAQSEATEVHAVRLTDLAPDTEYAYQVRTGAAVHDPRRFRTAPGPDGEVTAIVVGDTGSGDMPQEELAAVMEGMDADLLLHTGDVVYPRGGYCHYEQRYYEPYQELIASVPVFPVLGNHDLQTDNGEPYLAAFELPEASSGTERYYSFDYGPMHVTALDSELYHGDDSIPATEQREWLREDLRSTDRPWKVVVIHRPPYSSSPHHGGDQGILDDLVDIFEEEGVDIVFAGHDHVYERLEAVDGVHYIVTGGGGAELHGAGASERTVTSAARHHALGVEASPERMVIEAVGIEGEVFDRLELERAPEGRSARQVAAPASAVAITEPHRDTPLDRRSAIAA